MSENQTPAPEAGDEVVAEPVEQQEPEETGQDQTEPETEGQPEGDEPEESKSKARRERRKAELARLREDEANARQQAKEKADEVERLRAEAEKLPQPKLENFNSLDEYQAALAAFHSIKAVDDRDRRRLAEQAEADAKRADEARQMQQQEAAQYWAAQTEEGRTKYSDFDAVALSPSVPISEDLGAIILQSDVAADVTYHLGKNPELARQISGMQPMEMARAVGRLEAGLAAPKPKTVSGAPAPISPVKPKSTAMPDISKMSMAEYRKAREAGKLT